MCGFLGIYRTGAQENQIAQDEQDIRALMCHVNYRGPDESAFLRVGRLTLATSRLAMLDPDHGSQPMRSFDGRVVAAFNGEIYRHKLTRKKLTQLGYRFSTPDSDTETFCGLMSLLGVTALSKLDAQYAAAAYYPEDDRLVLVRDRFGIHPLYYRECGGNLYFGSSARAVAILSGHKRVSAFAVYLLLSLWGLPDPMSVFDGVQSVRPGYALAYTGQYVREIAVDPVSLPPAGEEQPIDHNALQAALDEAVSARLAADADLAILLSGGIDSAAVAQAAGQTGQSLPCYLVSNADEPPVETTNAQRVADICGHRLKILRPTNDELAAAVASTVQGCDGPFWRSGPIGFELLAQYMNANGVKGILTGDGADELFCGYDLYQTTLARIAIGSVDAQKSRQGLADLQLVASAKALIQRETRPFALGPYVSDDLLYSHLPRWRIYSGAALRVFAPHVRRALSGYDAYQYMHDHHSADLEPLSPVNRARLLELRTLFQGFLVSTQSDRPFMHHGIEGRYPFLSREVADIALITDPVQLFNPKRVKVPIRAILAKRLNPILAETPKRPYDPGALTLSVRLGAVCSKYLSTDALREGAVFDVERVTALTKATLGNATPRGVDIALLLGVLSTQVLLSV
jgi:asparagine synthase (glutamine-hydrolysing)